MGFGITFSFLFKIPIIQIQSYNVRDGVDKNSKIGDQSDMECILYELEGHFKWDQFGSNKKLFDKKK